MPHMICVENLYPEIYVAQLCEVFGKYGRILSANIEFDKNLVSLCKGYVCFDNSSSAQKAVKEMNGKKIIGRPMLVSMDLTEDSGILKKQYYTKIYVKNFDIDWDECNLIKEFDRFGDIANAQVSETNGKSNGYGFITFEKHSAAKAAIEAMHNQIINNKKLIVEPFLYKELRDKVKPKSLDSAKELLEKSVQLNNLHVKNIPKDMTEDDLKELFKEFGMIESVKVARDDKQQSRGFGFVCFSNAKDASKARDRMNNCSYKSKVLEVNFNQKKAFRQQYLQLINTDDKVRRFKQDAESVPLNPNKNCLFSFSAKRQ